MKMSVNDFVQGANAISSIITALNGVGVTGSAQSGILSQIQAAINPTKTAQIAACTSMMNFAAFAPSRVADIAKQLEVMQGLPVAAQGECEVLIAKASIPGVTAVDLDQIILSIEQVINNQ
jgi:cephalosporin-C deacetylase-like acetyl esterase